MATQQRIDDLNAYCKQWQESLENAERYRGELLDLQQNGVHIFDNTENDILPTMIKEADEAVRLFHRILIQMQSLRDRAVAGEDV